jgi:hypothetical protein
LQITGNLLNRGAFVTPLPIIEQFLKGKMRFAFREIIDTEE